MNKNVKEIIIYVLIIVAVILLRTFIVTPVRVEGSSMYKTLNNGDLLILYKLGDIKKNDIVVIKEKKSGEKIIKRIIGIPKDTIEIKNDKIYVNDKEVNDKYGFGMTSDYKKVTLKDDEYFVLGDNRLVSMDSREFGPVKENCIKGKAIFRFFPFTKIGVLR